MLNWLLIAALCLALIYAAVYVTMRRAFPPEDEAERMHMNKIGRRTLIAMAVMLLALVVYWMMR